MFTLIVFILSPRFYSRDAGCYLLIVLFPPRNRTGMHGCMTANCHQTRKMRLSQVEHPCPALSLQKKAGVNLFYIETYTIIRKITAPITAINRFSGAPDVSVSASASASYWDDFWKGFFLHFLHFVVSRQIVQ